MNQVVTLEKKSLFLKIVEPQKRACVPAYQLNQTQKVATEQAVLVLPPHTWPFDSKAQNYSQAFFLCYLSQDDGGRFRPSLLIH